MLSHRSATILKSIVEHYIDRAVPVPSQSIIHSYGLEVSSATIRNEMMQLEREGYIIRPHTSAGSIPSDKGYRFYVETLSDIRLPVNQQRMVSHLFHQVETRLEEWARLTATILAHLAQNMAVVATAKSTRSVFKHLELVSIQERTALMVLVLHGARVRQQLLTFNRDTSQEELSTASNKLNGNFAGLMSGQIDAGKLTLSDVERQAVDTVLAIMKAEDAVTYEETYMEGLQFIFNKPEFSGAQQALTLVDLLEQKNLMRLILPRELDEPGVHVIIGQENEARSIHNLSVILSQYGLPGEAVGCIAVIGPTRMPYVRSIASVGYLSDILTRLIARLYGKDTPPETMRNN
ncbi:MAG: heat-inducible transcriptional repressor HrcA [Dehalococcoidales bacterium]|nr:heat-inducible transcriptional repressor HrcA [Dehalococcoidales bacterium]